ncbi:hypothetical protein D3C71_1707440 [compost metagenome]
MFSFTAFFAFLDSGHIAHDIFYSTSIEVLGDRNAIVLPDDFNRVYDLDDLRMEFFLIYCLRRINNSLSRTVRAKCHFSVPPLPDIG